MRKITLATKFVEYLENFIGRPYLWGGDDPMSGFDCSGLAVEGLQAVGILARGTDYGAGSLSQMFPKVDQPLPGCLVFWHDGTGKVIHVEVVCDIVDGLVLTYGASGGGSKTTDLGAAIKANAYVKMRPVNGPGARTNLWGYTDPFANVA